jgi:hypothetical protein
MFHVCVQEKNKKLVKIRQLSSIIREFDLHFPGRWVGRDGTNPWPPRSPDVMPLKDIVYKAPVTSFDELKLIIIAAIETVTLQILESTWCEI